MTAVQLIRKLFSYLFIPSVPHWPCLVKLKLFFPMSQLRMQLLFVIWWMICSNIIELLRVLLQPMNCSIQILFWCQSLPPLLSKSIPYVILFTIYRALCFKLVFKLIQIHFSLSRIQSIQWDHVIYAHILFNSSRHTLHIPNFYS